MKLLPGENMLLERNMGKEIESFLRKTGEANWVKRLKQQANLEKNGKKPFASKLMQNKNPFLLPMKEYLNQRMIFKDIWKHSSPRVKWMAQKIASFNTIHEKVGDGARRKLNSRILDDNHLRSLLFEIKVAFHFLSKGYEVEFHDYENETGLKTFDFLIKKEALEGEVECKKITTDLGKMIHSDSVVSFSDEIYAVLKQSPGNYAVVLDCSCRLPKDTEKNRRIAKAVNAAIEKKEPIVFENMKMEVFSLPDRLPIVRTQVDAYSGPVRQLIPT